MRNRLFSAHMLLSLGFLILSFPLYYACGGQGSSKLDSSPSSTGTVRQVLPTPTASLPIPAVHQEYPAPQTAPAPTVQQEYPTPVPTPTPGGPAPTPVPTPTLESPTPAPTVQQEYPTPVPTPTPGGPAPTPGGPAPTPVPTPAGG